MTWQFSTTNIGGSSGAQFGTYRLKEMLKSVGWTIVLSGDGSGVSGAGDNWSGEPMPDFAWFVAQHPQHPTIPLQIRFRIESNPNAITWSFSPSGDYSGGTPTVAATASDEVSGHTSSNYYSSVAGVHVVAADDSAPYGFYMGGWEDNFAGAHSIFVFDPLVATDPLDEHEYIFFTGGDVTPSDAVIGSETTSTSASRCVGTIGNGAFGGTIPGLSYAAGAATPVAPTNEPRSPFTGNETIWPIVYGRRYSLTGEGYKGMGTVMYWGGSRQANHGQTLSINTTRDRIIYGEINLPWDGSVPPNLL